MIPLLFLFVPLLLLVVGGAVLKLLSLRKRCPNCQQGPIRKLDEAVKDIMQVEIMGGGEGGGGKMPMSTVQARYECLHCGHRWATERKEV